MSSDSDGWCFSSHFPSFNKARIMSIFVRRNGRMVNKRNGEVLLTEAERRAPIAAPSVWSDIAPYKSPLGEYWIDGRTARREDLKRNGCREVEPSEYRSEYRSSRMEARYAGSPGS